MQLVQSIRRYESLIDLSTVGQKLVQWGLRVSSQNLQSRHKLWYNLICLYLTRFRKYLPLTAGTQLRDFGPEETKDCLLTGREERDLWLSSIHLLPLSGLFVERVRCYSSSCCKPKPNKVLYSSSFSLKSRDPNPPLFQRVQSSEPLKDSHPYFSAARKDLRSQYIEREALQAEVDQSGYSQILAQRSIALKALMKGVRKRHRKALLFDTELK